MEWMLIVVAFAGAVAYVIYRGTRRSTQLRELAERGRPVAGRVASISNRMTKSGRRLHVVYEYQVDGRSHTGNSLLTRAEHDSLAKGGPIVVVYLPEDPTVAAPEFKLPSRSDA
ncbi:MAG TPA: DUF3592 domain-containing protein [Steroidobacteraceae bacterium]|nr:DUF3592 domain-containing protein [Steroidobacteraceae bacterium]